ncbi:MAG: DNA/RNA nuclease SfsA [Gammaproteobacteria bacterium]|nr:DNA/RNA nuclease SfsA [Gammaproteobacteria bacterium]MYK29542.1 DNA/RNA nuclease SfsA [Gammaproteobacteria bacterium]
MIYSPPLIEARLVRRHKRFLADVTLPDGSLLRAHCPNTGAMTGCSEPGSRVWLMDSGNERRKYRHTLELVASGEHLVCVNTARANQVVAAAIEEALIPPLAGYASWRREPAIPGGKGRFDLKLWDPAKGECYVELKSLTLGLADGYGAFPDAPSVRALKHVEELRRVRSELQCRAVLIFCVMHSGVRIATTADAIQPAYGEQVQQAIAEGVEVYAWRCLPTPQELIVDGPLPFVGTNSTALR